MINFTNNVALRNKLVIDISAVTKKPLLYCLICFTLEFNFNLIYYYTSNKKILNFNIKYI